MSVLFFFSKLGFFLEGNALLTQTNCNLYSNTTHGLIFVNVLVLKRTVSDHINIKYLGAVSICCVKGIGIPIIKSHIFIMAIPVHGKMVFMFKRVPGPRFDKMISSVQDSNVKIRLSYFHSGDPGTD